MTNSNGPRCTWSTRCASSLVTASTGNAWIRRRNA